MKNTKQILGVILNIIWFPALVIHEVSHLVIALLFFRIPKSFSIKFSLDSPVSGHVNLKEKDAKNKLVLALISLAPLFQIILLIILAQHYTFFSYILVYQIIAIHYSTPSIADLNNVLYSLNFLNSFRDFLFTNRIFNWLFPKYYDSINAEATEAFIADNF